MLEVYVCILFVLFIPSTPQRDISPQRGPPLYLRSFVSVTFQHATVNTLFWWHIQLCHWTKKEEDSSGCQIKHKERSGLGVEQTKHTRDTSRTKTHTRLTNGEKKVADCRTGEKKNDYGYWSVKENCSFIPQQCDAWRKVSRYRSIGIMKMGPTHRMKSFEDFSLIIISWNMSVNICTSFNCWMIWKVKNVRF